MSQRREDRAADRPVERRALLQAQHGAAEQDVNTTKASTGRLDSTSPRTPPSCSAICSLIEGSGSSPSSAVGDRLEAEFLDHLLGDLLDEPLLHGFLRALRGSLPGVTGAPPARSTGCR